MKGTRTGFHALAPNEKKQLVIEQAFAKTTIHPRTKRYRENGVKLK